MPGLYNSNGDVKTEAVRVDAVVNQTNQAILGTTAPTGINQSTGQTVNNLSVLVPSWQETAQSGTDTTDQLNSDWSSFYGTWVDFLTTLFTQAWLDQNGGLDNLPNYTQDPADLSDDWPNAAGWQQLQVLETALAALQTRANNLLGAGLVVIVGPNGQAPSATKTFTWWDWFGGSLGATGQIITMGCYIVGGGFILMTFGPIVADAVGLIDVPVREARVLGQGVVSRQQRRRNPGRKRPRRRNSVEASIATLESNRSSAQIDAARSRCGCSSGPKYRAALLASGKPMRYVHREYGGR